MREPFWAVVQLLWRVRKNNGYEPAVIIYYIYSNTAYLEFIVITLYLASLVYVTEHWCFLLQASTHTLACRWINAHYNPHVQRTFVPGKNSTLGNLVNNIFVLWFSTLVFAAPYDCHHDYDCHYDIGSHISFKCIKAMKRSVKSDLITVGGICQPPGRKLIKIMSSTCARYIFAIVKV